MTRVLKVGVLVDHLLRNADGQGSVCSKAPTEEMIDVLSRLKRQMPAALATAAKSPAAGSTSGIVTAFSKQDCHNAKVDTALAKFICTNDLSWPVCPNHIVRQYYQSPM